MKNHAKAKTEPLPEVPDFEVVERELWEIPTAYRKTKFRKALLARGFKLARQCYYHPTHWRAEDSTEDLLDQVDRDENSMVHIIDEMYLPLTDSAKAWLVSHNEEMDRLDREDAQGVEPESIPLSGDDISEALSAVESLLAGGPAKTNPDNPLLSAILGSMEEDAIPGYKRGREHTEAELRGLPPSSVIWIQYRKDDHGSLRFNGAYEITSYDANDPNTFYVHS